MASVTEIIDLLGFGTLELYLSLLELYTDVQEVEMILSLIALIILPKLYFINSPETLHKPGTLADIKVPAHQPSRFFFHLVNDTGKAQHFKASLDSLAKGEYGIEVSKAPGIAGILAAHDILENKYPIEGIFSKDILVPNGFTISGIIDSISETESEMKLSFGEGIIKENILTSPNIEEIKKIYLDKPKNLTYDVGIPREGLIFGDYGTTFRYLLTNSTNLKIKYTLFVKAIGNTIKLPFKIDDEVMISKLIPWHSKIKVASFEIKPGATVNISTIIPGGYCLPFKISFELC